MGVKTRGGVDDKELEEDDEAMRGKYAGKVYGDDDNVEFEDVWAQLASMASSSLMQ